LSGQGESVTNSETLDHHGSHRDLLWSGDRVQQSSIDAIIVPTIRAPGRLAPAAGLAKALGCTLVTLHSKQWTSAAMAAQRMHRSVDLIAVDVPDTQRLDLPEWRTSRLLTGQFARLRPSSDLSAKRNLGLALSRLLGWSRVMFLDDDITALNPDDVRRASGLLDTHNAVGLHVCRFHDHSVVCHAYREAGGRQQSFIGGGALVVEVERTRSFFPEVYNDDWFFLLDGDKGILPVAVTGRVEQYPYDPFRTPERARREEFGDVLAEGIYWLLDQDRPVVSADRDHWTAFLAKRRAFILRVLDMVASDGSLDTAERTRRLDALRGSLGRLARITPELCLQYVQAWKCDQETWQRHLEMLETGVARPEALRMLARPGAPPTSCRIGGRHTGPELVADPPLRPGRRPAATVPTTPYLPSRPHLPRAQEVRPRQLSSVGAEPSCSIGLP
jgi:hypothetical protein